MISFIKSISTLTLLWCTVAQAGDPILMQESDPYQVSLPAPTHEIQVRIFQHGLKDREHLIREELHAAEVTLSQCEGVVVRITPVHTEKTGASTAQERTVTFNGSTVYIDKAYMNFMQPFAMDRSRGPIDLHMTEYMDAEIRKTKQVTGQIHYGQAYNETALINGIFNDPRPEGARAPSFTEIMGNVLTLALETVSLHRKTFTRYPQYNSQPRHLSLLAHEMGHLILEAYDPIKKFYGDHFCPGLGDWCPRGHMMSGGGNDDSVYTDPKQNNKIIGYDPLTKLDFVQCERLKNSLLLKKL